MACVDVELCNKIDTLNANVADIYKIVEEQISYPVTTIEQTLTQLYHADQVQEEIHNINILFQVLILAMVIVYIGRWFWRTIN